MFSFIHCSDLHLGTPFSGLKRIGSELTVGLHNATFDAFDRLCTTAIEAQVDFMVIAGDIYDGIKYGPKTARFLRDRLEELVQAGVAVYVCLGNHDDVDDLLAGIVPLPRGVHVFSGEAPETFIHQTRSGELVALHGRSFPTRMVRFDLATGFPMASAGCYNIGVLHCTLAGSVGHETQAPVSTQKLASFGFDYWALGHIHTRSLTEVGECLISYSGNLQGLSIKPSERGDKGALLVKVEGGRPTVEFLPISRFKFDYLTVEAASNQSEAETEDVEDRVFGELLRIQEDLKAGTVLVLRIDLVGRYRGRALEADELNMVADNLNLSLRRAGIETIYVESLKSSMLPELTIEALSSLGGLLEAFDGAKGELSDPDLVQEYFNAMVPSGKNAAPPLLRTEYVDSIDPVQFIAEVCDEVLALLLEGGGES